MKPIKIANNVYNVGVSDWNIRDFHGYSTHRGTSYNAFLIQDEKTVLIDTVKAEFTGELIENIAAVIDPKKIDLVISNHTEMDHSGGLPRMMHYIGQDKPVYCSKMGFKNLAQHFGDTLNLKAVANLESMSIGKRSLTFIETRMMHWPDSMFTYLPEDKILFSSDAFGQHYAGPERFDDEIGDAIMPYAQKYYANILLCYARHLKKLGETVAEMDLPFDMICPDHGVIWRENPAKITEAYANWSLQKPQQKAVVVFDTMWHSTEKMAAEICDGLTEAGIPTRPMHLRSVHRSDVMTEVLDAGAIIVGSPTLNNGLFPTVADFLTYMKGLKPLNKIGAAFGSYGWSGEAVKYITEELQTMKFDMVEPGMRLQYVPDRDQLKQCFEFGRQIGEKLRAQQ